MVYKYLIEFDIINLYLISKNLPGPSNNHSSPAFRSLSLSSLKSKTAFNLNAELAGIYCKIVGG